MQPGGATHQMAGNVPLTLLRLGCLSAGFRREQTTSAASSIVPTPAIAPATPITTTVCGESSCGSGSGSSYERTNEIAPATTRFVFLSLP